MDWCDVSTKKFIELDSIEKDGSIEWWYSISERLGFEFELYNDLVEWIQSNQWLSKYPSGNIHNLLPFESLTLGNFLDVNYFATRKMYAELFATLDISEGNFKEKTTTALSMPITKTIGAMTHADKLFKTITDNFKTLFEAVEDTEEDESRPNFEDKSNTWEVLILKQVNGDFTKFNEYLELNLFTYLNLLSITKANKLFFE